MEQLGSSTFQEFWEGQQYDWTEEPVEKTAQRILATSEQNGGVRSDAEAVFASLTEALCHNTEGIDTSSAEHFASALGIPLTPYIVVDPAHVSEKDTRAALAGHGVEQRHQEATGLYRDINTIVIHPATLDRLHPDCSLPQALAHEFTHTKPLAGIAWEEGFAKVIEDTFALYHRGKEPGLGEPPYTVHDIGKLLAYGLITARPHTFTDVLGVLRHGSAEVYQSYLKGVYEVVGNRRFWFAAMTYGARTYREDIPREFKDIIEPVIAKLQRGESLLDGILPIVDKMLRDYERRTGYSFGPRPTGQPGVTPLEANAPGDESQVQSDLAALILKVADTMK